MVEMYDLEWRLGEIGQYALAGTPAARTTWPRGTLCSTNSTGPKWHRPR
jgi:hypothetical protein